MERVLIEFHASYMSGCVIKIPPCASLYERFISPFSHTLQRISCIITNLLLFLLLCKNARGPSHAEQAPTQEFELLFWSAERAHAHSNEYLKGENHGRKFPHPRLSHTPATLKSWRFNGSSQINWPNRLFLENHWDLSLKCDSVFWQCILTLRQHERLLWLESVYWR